jgi:putative transcriptional regulator
MRPAPPLASAPLDEPRRSKRARRRSLFRELVSGMSAMREHREGRLTLRTHRVDPITLPPLKPKLVRETREK